MKNNLKEDAGVQVLYKRYQKAFRIPENLHYYSAQDFKKAERKFIKYCLSNGIAEVLGRDQPFP